MILGLTGAFGSGKSSCLDFFRQRKWQIFDADGMCHGLYEDPPAELDSFLHALFGGECFDNRGRLDRSAAGKIVFSDPEKREKLTGAVYPFLRKNVTQEIARLRREKQNAVFEFPLLYETHWENCFDKVLAVWTEPSLRISRLAKRGFTPQDAALRDACQLPPEVKLEKADFAVINNGSPESLFQQLEALFKEE